MGRPAAADFNACCAWFELTQCAACRLTPAAAGLLASPYGLSQGRCLLCTPGLPAASCPGRCFNTCTACAGVKSPWWGLEQLSESAWLLWLQLLLTQEFKALHPVSSCRLCRRRLLRQDPAPPSVVVGTVIAVVIISCAAALFCRVCTICSVEMWVCVKSNLPPVAIRPSRSERRAVPNLKCDILVSCCKCCSEPNRWAVVEP